MPSRFEIRGSKWAFYDPAHGTMSRSEDILILVHPDWYARRLLHFGREPSSADFQLMPELNWIHTDTSGQGVGHS